MDSICHLIIITHRVKKSMCVAECRRSWTTVPRRRGTTSCAATSPSQRRTAPARPTDGASSRACSSWRPGSDWRLPPASPLPGSGSHLPTWSHQGPILNNFQKFCGFWGKKNQKAKIKKVLNNVNISFMVPFLTLPRTWIFIMKAKWFSYQYRFGNHLSQQGTSAG